MVLPASEAEKATTDKVKQGQKRKSAVLEPEPEEPEPEPNAKALFTWNKVPLYYPTLRPIRKPRLN
jgi:hypothetical protein